MPEDNGFELIVLTPPGLIDPSLAVAASRAGEVGVLDLEHAQDEKASQEALLRLARYGRGRIGVKLSGQATDFVARITPALPKSLSLAILTYGDPGQLQRQIETLRREGLSILLECTSLEEARAGERLGIDGVIAKGQEAGGRVGDETTFILLQRFLNRLSLPVWAQGGIGLHTAAACYAAGAAGVVLDSQLYLTRESPLGEPVRSKIAAMDGSETECLGQELGESHRVYVRPGLPAVAALREEERRLIESGLPQPEAVAAWRQALHQRIGWEPEEQAWLLGQDAAFAAPLAKRFANVAGVLQAMRRAIRSHWETARALRPLDEDSPLAQSHDTRYPIVQGPMTRVSDVPAFAAAVAQGGGLPFLALALMRGQDVKRLLEETRELLQDRPWGVGILGFVPLELREEQLEAIREFRPPFALIAGGRPDQARALEAEGIPTYLHVPSPGLLELFLADGAQRFVFEGRECGGHVGPRSSFVLWESMIEVLLERLPSEREKARAYHVLFAGGIHDALSASMVAVMAAPLAERGVRSGVLMGTAYMFTEEAITSRAIARPFQEEAIRCERTALLATGPGHATRCMETPYVETFLEQRRHLERDGRSPEETRLALEELNLGRLRIAAKGIARRGQTDSEPASPFITLSEDEQRAQGLYMIGQVAALRRETITIKDLHHDVAVGGSQRLETFLHGEEGASPGEAAQPSDIAIVGMSCMLPKAPNLQAYWQNILNKVNAITEVPPSRWDWRLYYDPDPRAKDKVYSKWGGFIDDIPFNPMSYGMPPSSLPSIEPLHLLTLEAVRAALKDAGYLDRPYDRERVSVILGAGGAGDLGQLYGFRSFLPQFLGDSASEVLGRLDGILPQWTEDSFPGILMNVAAGRVANRFDLGGVNYTVDAACASSLAAVQLAVKELEGRTSDMVIVGGADTIQSPFVYLCFSKTYALSPSGQCRTFDEKADGIAISEGIGILVLKRLADAERDGDRIYAVIKGISGSSDGRDKGLTAPRPEGQMRALRRAYAKAGVSSATVGLVEAHGTGTIVGDQAELLSLTQVFDEAQAPRQGCAIGSVKSMIGHTKNAAGVAGVMKTALALHHRLLPPTLGVEKPTPKVNLSDGPLYINTELRPWIQRDDKPRRAAVSAFGFGGTNFHAVLEEYAGDYLTDPAKAHLRRRPAELLLWQRDSRQELVKAIDSLERDLAQGAQPPLADLAFTLHRAYQAARKSGSSPMATLAVVASSLEDLRAKLPFAREHLASSSDARVAEPRGVYFSESPLAPEGKIAFLFPGQGSQFVNMLLDLAIDFPEVQESFERADQVLKDLLPKPLSAYIFPPPCFSREEEKAQEEALTQTNVAQPAMGVADLALFSLLEQFGVRPDFLAGHSYGEYVALCAAGVLSREDLLVLSEARGRFIVEGAGNEPGSMVAVEAGPETIGQALAGVEDAVIANHNAPRQTIIAGTKSALEEATQRLKSQGVQARPIRVACAFHSPIVAPAQEKLAQLLGSMELKEPSVAVFSNTTAAPYPREPKAIAGQLVEHLARPVRFVEEIEAMYEAGARIFIEVGPRNVLIALVDQILGDRPCLALATDQPRRPATVHLLHVLGRLAAAGMPVNLDRLFDGAAVNRLDLNNLPKDAGRDAAPGLWLVNGGRVRPAGDRPTAGQEKPPAGAAARDTQAAAASPPRPAVEGPSAPATPPPPGLPDLASAAAAVQGAGTTGGDEASQVMGQFQQLMQRFLETQQNVMLAYLRSLHGGVRTGSPMAEGRTPTPAQAPPLAAPSPVAAAPEAGAGADAAEAPPQAQAAPNEEELTSRLLHLVSERTGYPPEMLDLDLDLEADLGIDSIKRVEILGNYQRLYALPDNPVSDAEMERLTTIRTLRGIIEWIKGYISSASPAGAQVRDGSRPPHDGGDQPTTQAAKESAEQRAGEESPLQRYTLAPAEVPLPSSHAGTLNLAGLVVLTDDERGIARSLADQLTAQGRQVALVRLGGETTETAPGRYTADLTSPEGVAEVLEIVRRQGSIGALVHLLPLKDSEAFSGMDLAAWRGRLQLELKSLFYLAQQTRQDLEHAARQGGACLLAATAMGGAFAGDGSLAEKTFLPSHGGVAGLAKTLAQEWPEVRVLVVDLDPREPVAALAGQVRQELAAGDGLVEVGYAGNRRLALRAHPAPLRDGDGPSPAIDSSSVLLITGGARGITAEVARDLAQRYRPTLLLVGRSPMPEPEEAPDTAGLSKPQELKAALIEGMRREGREPVLAQVEAEYTRLQREREIRRNLAAPKGAGAAVHYFPVDVRDEAAFGGLIDWIYDTFGRIDGVIHGAGTIEDKLLKDKSPESFDRVLGSKVDGAFILSRKLQPDSLKLLVFFSSAAARFGNRGQGDYAAANEVLNKLALYLDSLWPGRVVSINWGPWANQGMVTPELEKEFARRGIRLIAPSAGCRSLDQELRYGRKGEVEVLLTAGEWPAPPESQPHRQERPLPMLGHAVPSRKADGSLMVAFTLDPLRDPYLRDHQMDGKPVLPMAVATELMAEAASLACPEMDLLAVRDLRVLRGIVLDSEPRAIQISARPPAARSSHRVEVEVSIAGQESPQRPYYRAVVEMAPGLPQPPAAETPLTETKPFPLSTDEAYRQWLFQGSVFHGLDTIQGVGSGGIMGSLKPSTPQQLLAGDPEGTWLIDPVVIDSGLQLVMLWTRVHLEKTPLPAGFRAYRRFGPLAGGQIDCRVHVRREDGSPLFHYDLFFIGSDGRVLGVMEGLEVTSSRALNRLSERSDP